MRIAIASVPWLPAEFGDDQRLIAALRDRGAEASSEPWGPGVDWERFGLVVIRSTWDYASRRGEFLGWADAVGPRLENPPAVIRWNTDKLYLRDLAEAGVAVVETSFLAPGDPAPELEGEVVVKPSVSAGGRDTGRFAPQRHDEARELIARIAAGGRVAMVQPYLEGVDRVGETAIVFIDGEPSHALRKRAVLREQGVAPVRDDELGAAEVMYDPELVGPASATEAELATARDLIAAVGERFGQVPLYARVDLVPGPAGEPILLELEAVEPNLYLEHGGEATAALADAILARAGARVD